MFDSRQEKETVLHFAAAFMAVLGSTQPPIQWVPGVLSPGIKRPGHEADHPPPTAEVKNAWSYTYIPQYVPMACCLVKHHSCNFNLPNLVGYHGHYVRTATPNRGGGGRSVKFSTHFHLMPKLNMHTALPPLTQYVFTEQAYTTHT
jgi:hypothetical protein